MMKQVASATEQAASETTPTMSSADVVVYSGVPCGIAAAITVARQGVSVLLIEPTQHVGGLSTSGINTAESEHMLKWTIGGFADEFYRRLGAHYKLDRPEYYFESSVAEKVYKEMLSDAGVNVRYGTRVASVTKVDTQIRSITLTDGTQASGKVFIDASYEGDLMARAGVSYVVGREAKSEFGEEAAGIRFDKTPRRARTVDAQGNLLPGISARSKDLREGDSHAAPMNYNFRLTVAKDPKLQVPFPLPKRYDAGRYALLAAWFKNQTSADKSVVLYDIIDLYGRRNGKFELNNKQSAIISLGILVVNLNGRMPVTSVAMRFIKIISITRLVAALSGYRQFRARVSTTRDEIARVASRRVCRQRSFALSTVCS